MVLHNGIVFFLYYVILSSNSRSSSSKEQGQIKLRDSGGWSLSQLVQLLMKISTGASNNPPFLETPALSLR